MLASLFCSLLLAAPPAQANASPTAHIETTVARADLEALLNDVGALSRQARVIPHYVDGKHRGMKLVGIRPKSSVRAFGFQSGDIVQAINGLALDRPAAVLEVFESLKTSDVFKFEMLRAGQPLKLVIRLTGERGAVTAVSKGLPPAERAKISFSGEFDTQLRLPEPDKKPAISRLRSTQATLHIELGEIKETLTLSTVEGSGKMRRGRLMLDQMSAAGPDLTATVERGEISFQMGRGPMLRAKLRVRLSQHGQARTQSSKLWQKLVVLDPAIAPLATGQELKLKCSLAQRHSRCEVTP